MRESPTEGEHSENIRRRRRTARRIFFLCMTGGFLMGQCILSLLPVKTWLPHEQYYAGALIPTGSAAIGVAIAYRLQKDVRAVMRSSWRLLLVIVVLFAIVLVLMQPL
jgi:type IV secretory pathway component VirB8